MSKIDDLIFEYCPEGVSFKELESIIKKVDRSNQNVPKSKIKSHGHYPVYTQSANLSPDGYSDDDSKVVNDVPLILYGDHTNVLKWISNDFIIGADGVKLVKPSIDSGLQNRFLYHYLCEKIEDIPNGYARHFAKLKTVKIPTPPTIVQNAIIDILDKFTLLETELETELETRRKQYEFYRNNLFDNIVLKDSQKLSLDDVCTKVDRIKWKNHTDKRFTYIDLSSVNRNNNYISKPQTINYKNAPSRAQQILNDEDVIFGTTRPTLNRLCYITKDYEGQICSTGFCVLRADKSIILPRYLYFLLTTNEFYNFVASNQEGAGYPSISDTKLKSYNIMVPKLSEQKRVVNILNKFDRLVNSINEGLPAELVARRKQYEHYRNKLLTFPELVA